MSTFFQAQKNDRQKGDRLRTGWLTKQGGVIKSWQKRWFVLVSDSLYYYTNEEETKLLGSIYLPGNKVIEVPMSPNELDKFPFEIQAGSDKSRITLTHESYPLYASTEDDRKYWIQSIKKAMYGDKGGAIFGQTLKETMLFESKQSSRKVPCIVEMCVEFLLQNGLEIEGIFRLPGRTVLIKKLKELFDTGEGTQFILPDVDVHTVASLLKLYLRELPEPIIPRKFYEPVMKIVQRDMQLNPDSAMADLKTLLTHIPKFSYNLIQYLSNFLHEVSKKSGINKMTAMNLATVFVHSIIRPEDEDPALLMGTANGRTQVTFVLITTYHQLFTMEYNSKGRAVKIDQLLDIEETPREKTFNPDTSAKVGLTDDLLDLDLNDKTSEVPLPLPIQAEQSVLSEADSAEAVPFDNADESLNAAEKKDLTDLDPYASNEPNLDTQDQVENIPTKRDHAPVPSRPAPLVPPKQQSTQKPVIMRAKSTPKPRPRNISGDCSNLNSDDQSPPINTKDITPPPRPPKPRSSSFHTTKSEIPSAAGEKPVPVRPAPRPPLRPSKSSDTINEKSQDAISINQSSLKTSHSSYLVTSISTESDGQHMALPAICDDDTDAKNDVDVEAYSLLNKNTDTYSIEEMRQHSETLKNELFKYIVANKKLKSDLEKAMEKHKGQILEMAKQIEDERLATANAVEKVMELQNQRQLFDMKYGDQ